MSLTLRKLLLRSVEADTARLVRLQKAMQHPWLDVFFKFAAKCGDEIVYTVMLPLAVWNLNNEFARHFIYLWCIVFYVIHFLKDIFTLPRPPTPPVRRLEEDYAQEHGFPSAHSGAASSLPIFAVLQFAQSAEFIPSVLAIGLAVTYCLTVSLSRLYVGVHSFTDVLGGWLIGMSTVYFWDMVKTDVDYWLLNHPLAPVAVFIGALLLVAAYPRNGKQPSFDLTMSVLSCSVGVHLGMWLREGAGQSFAALVLPPSVFEFSPTVFVTEAALRALIGFPLCLSVSSAVKSIVSRLIGYNAPPKVAHVEGVPRAPLGALVKWGPGLTVRWCKYMSMGFAVVVVAPLCYFGGSSGAALL